MEHIIAPYQTVLITCRGNADLIGRVVEKDNVSVVNFHAPVSRDPALYMVCLHKKRLSVNIIRDAKHFVVNFMPFSQMETVKFVDKYNGLQLDKFSKVEKEEAKIIDCPRLVHGLGYLECDVRQELDLGDHIGFIGGVMHSEFRRDGRRLLNLGNNNFMGLEIR